jgi:hypothetical protein
MAPVTRLWADTSDRAILRREESLVIAAWHPVAHDPSVRAALEATLHGRTLHVEQRTGEPGWRWRITSGHGHVLADGRASDAHAAERAAEDELYRAHPPTGDAAGWWLDE